MKPLSIFLGGMAIVSMARAEPLDLNKPHKGKQAQTGQVQTPTTVAPRVQTGANARFYGNRNLSRGSLSGNAGVNANVNANARLLRQAHRQERLHAGNLSNSQVESVKFRANNHVAGSEKWPGQKYAAFRSYHAQWHDHDWWRHHHTRIILISGGWYYWDAGWWYPAWGYDPVYCYYPYDGPIYAYNDLPPDQVIADVQSSLQEQGYYTGEVDGLLGPLTRAALADYQRDHGLYMTAAIDQPTLASLGMG